MAEEQRKVEIGFGIGQVVSVKLTDKQLADLRKAVEKGEGWYDLKTQDETVALNVATVLFIRVADSAHTIGFSS
jgi:hypothetical protein